MANNIDVTPSDEVVEEVLTEIAHEYDKMFPNLQAVILEYFRQ